MFRSVVTGLMALIVCAPVFAAPVKLGVYPSNDPAKLQRVMKVFADYLSDKTGDAVSATVTRDYDELVERLRDRTIDIAWINTLNYVKIKKALPEIEYLATYMEMNPDTGAIQPYYQAYIVALKNGGPASLEEGRGKRFAFVDISSTSGYGYPNLLLRKRGIDADRYFGKVFFLKKHDRVIEALLAGSIDLGAVSDGTYHTAVRKHGDRFAILAKSDPIPLDAIVAVAGFPADRVEIYRKAMIEMPADHVFCRNMRDVLGWFAAGFELRGDSFYDSAREALVP